MTPLTPDEINALCEIPEDIYADLAMQVQAEARTQGRTLTLDEMDREVLVRWYGRDDAPG